MILGSHNSWSFLSLRKWWKYPFRFTAKCQDIDIMNQYINFNVKCFDLRVRFDKYNNIIIAHGWIEYKYSKEQLMNDLKFINDMGDCYVRILHEARNKKQYTEKSVVLFSEFISEIKNKFPNIRFWCGRNLYNWEYDYIFTDKEPTCEELYASVCAPKILDDWYPRWYAYNHNKEIIKKGTDKDILLIDFVNYGY